jgi:arsenate reductase
MPKSAAQTTQIAKKMRSPLDIPFDLRDDGTSGSRGRATIRYHRDVIQIFGTDKCKVTRAAQRFFADRRIRVQMIDLREKGLSKGELESVARAVGGMQALYDKDGARAKARGLQHAAPDDARLLELFVEDPSLLRTPIVRDGKNATIGDDPATWKVFAQAAKSAG